LVPVALSVVLVLLLEPPKNELHPEHLAVYCQCVLLVWVPVLKSVYEALLSVVGAT